MTRAEFIAAYAARSGPNVEITEDGIRVGSRRRVALRCACGEEACQGWAMVNDDPEAIADHMALYAPRDADYSPGAP